ncbi:hypothetical protein MIND_00983100 [Mycena indigotica]|uniref:Uncharacterized protein n=1 Tax=Mycena indigotica TaxID=2126181 RepID=A0A8H6SDJ9_9AGAR|nr:uncharacterized protein MIND_00983100 [Mycena indigotica]KAF7297493.1 hypothetical protein MIND_00983100 [Mycena indigotica]
MSPPPTCLGLSERGFERLAVLVGLAMSPFWLHTSLIQPDSIAIHLAADTPLVWRIAHILEQWVGGYGLLFTMCGARNVFIWGCERLCDEPEDEEAQRDRMICEMMNRAEVAATSARKVPDEAPNSESDEPPMFPVVLTWAAELHNAHCALTSFGGLLFALAILCHRMASHNQAPKAWTFLDVLKYLWAGAIGAVLFIGFGLAVRGVWYWALGHWNRTAAPALVEEEA